MAGIGVAETRGGWQRKPWHDIGSANHNSDGAAARKAYVVKRSDVIA